uniref:Deoxyhypusine hydroxylase n=1 Tax=Meloidogyne floridensis TaxID=298350 RepID=A0A915NZ71_9BILA
MAISNEQIVDAGKVLLNQSNSLAARFRALFLLRNAKDDLSVKLICECFSDPSVLLKHELAYCLGQMQNQTAILLEGVSHEPMFRHEAGEALAAIGDPVNKFGVAEILKKYSNDPVVEVAETCQLALEMILWRKSNGNIPRSQYDSIDPAPPLDDENKTVDELTLWERYRALFALRNLNTDAATKAIAKGLFSEDSALFRHEVAYVLGQIQSPVVISELKERLSSLNESGMVRHECAEALGSIGTEECRQILVEFLKDKERVVRESCEVALNIAAGEDSQFGNNDLGRLYNVTEDHAKSLSFDLVLPKDFRALTSTLQEYVWMFRQQTLEAFKCIQKFENGQDTQRLLIWGNWGTGKTITLCQLAHLALNQNFVIVTIHDAMAWGRDNYYEVEVSSYKTGRLNSPHWATKILNLFKQQNQHNWSALSNLKASKKYEWSQMEQTEIGKPITEIVEIGLSAPYLATDCLGALFKELRIHATSGEIKLLVLIDKANGLFGKCVVRRPDRTTADIDELTLTIQIRKFLFSNWSNGLCAFVADKAEASNARDNVTIVPTDPEALFGDLNYEKLKPFISLKTNLYSEEEINVMHQYFLEKNWLRQEKGLPGEEAKKQLIFLSAFNPAYYEKICAMSWNLQCVPPTPVNF